MSSAIAKLRRVQELFDVGRPLFITTADGESISLWITKPTTFIRDEAIRDGRGARARALMAWDADSDDKASAMSDIADLEADQMVEILARNEESEHLRLASDEIRTEEAWAEKIEALRAVDLEGATPEEVAAVNAVTQEFNLELVTRTQALYDEERARLSSLERDELEKLVLKGQRDRAGANAFSEARRVTEVWRCLRDCFATEVDGRLSHDACNGHRAQFLDKRAEVYELPEAIIARVSDILANLQMPEAEAGNSDAPSVSSAPLEQRSRPEGSEPSTPTEM